MKLNIKWKGKEYVLKYDFNLKEKKDNNLKNNLSKIKFGPKYIIFFWRFLGIFNYKIFYYFLNKLIIFFNKKMYPTIKS